MRAIQVQSKPRVRRWREEESWSWLLRASSALESKSVITEASVEDSPLDTASEELLTTWDSDCGLGETWFWFWKDTLISSSVVSQLLWPSTVSIDLAKQRWSKYGWFLSWWGFVLPPNQIQHLHLQIYLGLEKSVNKWNVEE